ncbi:MAG: hypothetical protein QOI84_661 [Solirubrobacterales bacterium]|nr:hypothetical protein [Solirubrobacterales bacterium]
MVFAVAETPAWLLLAIPTLTALLGFMVGQLVPEFLKRRAAGRERYDAAITAVSRAHAARFGVGLGIPMEWLKSPDAATHAATESELSKAAMERYLVASAEARSALAALHPWSPDLQVYWDGTLLREEHFDNVIAILYGRRRSPLKRYGNSAKASPAERKP